MWEKVHFPPQMQPRFIEIPGHGNKLHESCPEKMIEIAQLIAPELEDTEFNIIGHSMGGYLIGSLLEIGIRPQKIGLFHSKLGEDHAEKREQRRRAIDLVKENKLLYIKTMISNLFSPDQKESFKEIIAVLVQHALPISIETITHCQLAMMSRMDGISLIRELSIPTLYFAGKQDQSVPIEQIDGEKKLLAELAQVTKIQDIGHMGHIEAPQAFSDWMEKNFN